jgi:predicted esterase
MRGICCWLALFLLIQSAAVFGQGEPIHYDSGYTWRGYTGSTPFSCPSKLCHYQPYYHWDPFYTEFTAWRSTTDNPNTARAFINFRVMFPPGYNVNDVTTKYPLVLVLHGAGESGRVWTGRFTYEPTDSLYDNNSHHLRYGAIEHVNAAKRPVTDPRSCKAIVVYPQASYNGAWSELSNMTVSEQEEMLLGFLETQMIAKYHADPNRVIAHGLSSGAKEIWSLASKRPDLFAAIIAMSAVPANFEITSEAVKHLPIWIFQGEIDDNPTQTVADSWVAALQAKGNTPRYTVYEDLGHATWYRAYHEPDFFSWIMGKDQRNSISAASTVICIEPITITAITGMAAYQWMRNGEDLPGQIAQNVTVATEGTYTAKFQRPSGEWDVSNSIALTKDPSPACVVVTGVNDGSEAVAYPNPTLDFVNIRSGQKTDPANVQVISMSGQVMNANVEATTETEVTVDLRSAGPGLYVIRLRNTGQRFVVMRK